MRFNVCDKDGNRAIEIPQSRVDRIMKNVWNPRIVPAKIAVHEV